MRVDPACISSQRINLLVSSPLLRRRPMHFHLYLILEPYTERPPKHMVRHSHCTFNVIRARIYFVQHFYYFTKLHTPIDVNTHKPESDTFVPPSTLEQKFRSCSGKTSMTILDSPSKLIISEIRFVVIPTFETSRGLIRLSRLRYDARRLLKSFGC